jgi:hypothetical protein
VEKFGLLARFGFMHLIATNVSLWIRTVVWESANEWLHYLHHQQQLHHGAGGAGAVSTLDALVAVTCLVPITPILTMKLISLPPIILTTLPV